MTLLTAEGRIEVIRGYAWDNPDIRTFIETGTAQGNTPAALMDEFDQLYTIEIDEAFFHAAVRRFAGTKVQPLWGNSPEVLSGLCREVGPALYWLDGHFCGGATGPKECPLLGELQVIVWHGKPNVILIDDARLFGADPVLPHTERWPTYEEVVAALPGYEVELKDDVVRAIHHSIS